MSRADKFFQRHVRPNLEDWNESPLDVRKAMNLAVSLNQTADYFWNDYSSTDRDRVLGAASLSKFREALSKKNPNFSVIRDVADAHKHLKLNRAERVLTSADQTGLGSIGWGEAEFGVAAYGGGEEVVIELDSGRTRHFSAVVNEVIVMWEDMLRAT